MAKRPRSTVRKKRTKSVVATEEILSSAWAKVLGLLMLRVDEPLHLREIARQSGVAVGQLQRELRGLEAAGLLVRRRSGGRVLYRPAVDHPLHDALRDLLIAEAGGVDRFVREALAPLGPTAVLRVGVGEIVVVGIAADAVLEAVAPLEARLGVRLTVTALPHRPTDGALAAWWARRVAEGSFLIGE